MRNKTFSDKRTLMATLKATLAGISVIVGDCVCYCYGHSKTVSFVVMTAHIDVNARSLHPRNQPFQSERCD